MVKLLKKSRDGSRRRTDEELISRQRHMPPMRLRRLPNGEIRQIPTSPRLSSGTFRRPLGSSPINRRSSSPRLSPSSPRISRHSSRHSSMSSSREECPVCFENTSKGNLCVVEDNIIHPLCRTCFNTIREGNNKCPICRRRLNRLVNLPTDGSLKACPPGKTRSRKGHCVKIWSRSPRRKSLNPGYELNRKTGRLRKVCPSGKKRSRKGRCVKI